MFINFYSNNIEYGVTIPVKAYKINTVSDKKSKTVDVLGDLILDLLVEGEKFDENRLLNIIGMPHKYEKLVRYEINELRDNKNIVIKDGYIYKIDRKTKYIEIFYVLYDCINNRFMDYIIDQRSFERNYLKKDNDLRNLNLYNIEKNSNKNFSKLENYKVCYGIEQLITSSNKICNVYEAEENEIDFIENNVFGPHYEIYLENVENIENPIIADFIIKLNFNEKGNVYFEEPFTKSIDSIYINKYVANKVKEEQLIKMINNNDFDEMIDCENKSLEKVEEYKKYDICFNKNDLNAYNQRIESAKKVFMFYELLNIEKDIYKNYSSPILELEKIIKSILKEIVDKFKESKMTRKATAVNDFVELDEINNIKDIKIIELLLDKKSKKICEGRKIIEFIGQDSIVSYLRCIYLSKFFTDDKYEEEVFNLFSKDSDIIKFLNDVWLCRNNTVHSIEKESKYEVEFDMDNMQKERLQEVFEELTEGLMNFIKKINKIRGDNCENERE